MAAMARHWRFSPRLLLVMVFAMLPAPIWADEAGDLFLNAYLLREEGSKAEKNGDYKIAYDRFRAAARIYEQISRDHPDWKPAMVNFRRNDMATEISKVADKAAKMDLGRPATDTRPLPAGSSLPTTQSQASSTLPREARPISSTPSVAIRPPTSASPTADDPYARKRIAELEQRQAGTQRVLEQLSQERDALKSSLADVENARLLANHEAKTYRAERDTLRQELTQLQEKGINSSVADKARVASLQKSLAAAESKIAALEENAKIAQEKNEKSAAANAQALKAATNAEAEAATRAANADRELQEARSKIARLEAVEAEAVKARDLARTTAEELARTRTRLATLENSQQDLEASKLEAEKLKAESQEIIQKLDAARTKIAQLEADKAKIADTLTQSSEEQQKRAQQTAEELAAAKAEIARLESLRAEQTAKLEAALAIVAQKPVSPNTKTDPAPNTAAVKEIVELKAKIALLEKARATAEKSAQEAETNAKAVSATNAEELAALRAKIRALETAAQTPPTELLKAQNRLKEVEALLAAATAEAKRHAEDLAAVTAERDQIRSERDQLAARLASMEKSPDLTQTNERLEKELNEARRQLAELTSAREQDATSIQALRTKLENVEGELSAVRKENADFRDRMAQLEKSLSEAQSALETATNTTDAELAEENRTLKSIVVRQLRLQSYRSRARKLLLSELAKLEINSKAMLQYIDQLEGKDVLPSPEEVTRIDDHYIRALSNVELTGKFFKQDTPPTTPTESTALASNTTPEVPQPSNPAGNDKPVPPPALPPELAGNADARDAFDFQKRSLAATAETLFQKGDFTRAEETYRLIVDADPSDIRMQCNLGVSLLKQGKFPDAINRFQEALRYNESNAFAHLMLGVCHWKLSQPDMAVDRFNRSLVIDSSNPQSWLYLGLVAIDRKAWQDAETAFKKALEFRPDDADANYNLAVVYTKPGFADPVEARRRYEKSLKLGGAKDEALELFLRVGPNATTSNKANPASQSTGTSAHDLPVLPDTAVSDPVIPPDSSDEELPQL